MTAADTAADPAAAGAPSGRPGAGAVLAEQMAEAAGRRAKRRDVRPLRALAPYLLAHKGLAAAAFGFLLASTAATLTLTAAARLIVDRGFGGDAAALNRNFLIAAAVVLCVGAASAARFYFVTQLGERVVADLRRGLYAHVLTLDQRFFATTRTGEVLSRMTTDITLVESLVGSSASVALRNLITLVGATALLMVVSPRLTLFVVLLTPLVLGPIFLFGRRVRTLSARAQDRFADAVAYAGESLDALDTVQAFNREGTAARRFAQAVETAFQASLKRIQVRALMTAVVMAVAFGGILSVLWLGAHAVNAGTMSAGTLVQFVFLSVMAAGAVGALGETWGDVQKAAGAMERIDELLQVRPAIAAPASPRPLPLPARGEVRFEGVSFTYPGRPDLPALRGFDLHVRPGETVALVGPSGGGKSTVFRLLLRLYDPDAGRVLLDGVDLREADPAEVRARLALVAQDAALFSGSAYDNLRYGREDATPEALAAAARDAEAEGFLAALPQGPDTPLGERGRSLSGGQRQRLAIARAVVRDAPVLLLDEATSALDAENERLVQAALRRAQQSERGARTTLVIAHRLATVLEADRIVVMDAGAVVESGTHAELTARGGLYARLARLQFAGEAA